MASNFSIIEMSYMFFDWTNTIAVLLNPKKVNSVHGKESEKPIPFLRKLQRNAGCKIGIRPQGIYLETSIRYIEES